MDLHHVMPFVVIVVAVVKLLSLILLLYSFLRKGHWHAEALRRSLSMAMGTGDSNSSVLTKAMEQGAIWIKALETLSIFSFARKDENYQKYHGE
jgi:hypothetical protein